MSPVYRTVCKHCKKMMSWTVTPRISEEELRALCMAMSEKGGVAFDVDEQILATWLKDKFGIEVMKNDSKRRRTSKTA